MLTNKFCEKVMNSVFVDTRKYRYTSCVRHCEGTRCVYIKRVPLEALGTTEAYHERVCRVLEGR